VPVQGTLAEREVPYTALLCQEYRDGATACLDVEGVLTFTALTNLTTLFQQPRFLASDLLSPTTTTTTTRAVPAGTTSAPAASSSFLVDQQKDSVSSVVERTFRSSRPESDNHLAPAALPATLFPPTEPPAPTPNPLRQFYPVEDDPVVIARDDGVLAAQVSAASQNRGQVSGLAAPSSLIVFLLSLISSIVVGM
jgi:hypothetical protein